MIRAEAYQQGARNQEANNFPLNPASPQSFAGCLHSVGIQECYTINNDLVSMTDQDQTPPGNRWKHCKATTACKG